MARISRTEHPRILRMVDGERRKVAEVAAEYGCTAANIYALLGKLRRDARANPAAVAHDPLLFDGPSSPAAADAEPSSASRAETVEEGRVQAIIQSRPAASVADAPAKPTFPPAATSPVHEARDVSGPSRHAEVTNLSRERLAKKVTGVGAALARPGMALMMRTAEGEENLTPFRSLDDLLSAIKPILRAAARSPDAVWFSIQPVDLASLDSDAA